MVLGELNDRYVCCLDHKRMYLKWFAQVDKLYLSFCFMDYMLDLVSVNQKGGVYQQRTGERQ